MEVDKIDTGKTFPEVEMLWYSKDNVVRLKEEAVLTIDKTFNDGMTGEAWFEALNRLSNEDIVNMIHMLRTSGQ